MGLVCNVRCYGIHPLMLYSLMVTNTKKHLKCSVLHFGGIISQVNALPICHSSSQRGWEWFSRTVLIQFFISLSVTNSRASSSSLTQSWPSSLVCRVCWLHHLSKPQKTEQTAIDRSSWGVCCTWQISVSSTGLPWSFCKPQSSCVYHFSTSSPRIKLRQVISSFHCQLFLPLVTIMSIKQTNENK